MSETIDLNFRPASYFRPQRLEEHLLSKVKGAVLKRQLKTLFSEGRHADVKDLLGTEGISASDRKALEAWHPMFMGGNYLPDTDDGEVEIARISIASTTWDVTSVYARPDDGVIRYRVVDEYGGDTLTGVTDTKSEKPLTLEEFADFFLKAWPLLDVLEMNFEDDLDGRLGFFTVDSDFYPDFDRLCRQRVVADFAPTESDKNESAKPDARPADIAAAIYEAVCGDGGKEISEPDAGADLAGGRSERKAWRAATAEMKPGTLCVVTSGEDVAPGVSAGQVVRFLRAPIPGTAVALFQYAPGEYAFSSSDGLWVGKDNAHYCCLIDRTRLRLLEQWESTAAVLF